MIIDEEYIISCFYLKSGKILRNNLFFNKQKNGFNFYKLEEKSKQMKLFMRTKGKDDKGEDCIVEKLISIISPDAIECIDVEEIENIENDILELLDIFVDDKGIINED